MAKLIECITLRMNPCVDISSSVVTNVSSVGGMLIIEEALHVWGLDIYWEISVPSPELCCESKTALKTQS